MARIPYPDLDDPTIAPVVERIVAERGRVLKLYEMLLHSPPVAAGWLGFLTAIRQQCLLSGRIRELVIMRVAVINGAEYEFRAHIPFSLKEGISQLQINDLREGQFATFDVSERAALDYCESMTRNVKVPETVFAAVRLHFNDRELVELTATIGAYNLVSRFLEALQVDHE
ncbi:carboxymuconolactone decarboxylase family protein [Glaciimonas sp. PCH181]|uniref:carboxymuconolactone decarboxylase family protein n=1 Tax=Glaciimonas sp. PCH181 TaxID=2133943 RepID=UPI000D374B15|nr:carboxymuconolactone decarboxylase family protein [Glaciimonas sp. PCH181]PUA19842.1 carboxymuconolactone decarboxylase [Glaciimonas sp. PCH181]